MNQHDKILSLLKQAKTQGINSFVAREQLHIIQLPVRIKELKEKGYLITTRQNKDRSVNYILLQTPNQRVFNNGEEPQWQWDFVGNTARKILVNQKPMQQNLI